MNYKNIRNNARKLYRQNFKLYLLVALAIAAAWAINYSNATFVVNIIISVGTALLLYPVTIGSMVFFYDEYMGGHGKFTDLFRFYRDKPRLLKTLAFGAIMLAPGYVYTYSIYLFRFLGEKYPAMGVLIQTVPPLLVGLAFMWFLVRIYPAPYIFGLNPQTNVFSTIKESFVKTKGYVLDWILFTLSVIWPILLSAFLLLITAAYSSVDMRWPFLVIAPLVIFITPYWYLCTAGFCSELINNDGKHKK